METTPDKPWLKRRAILYYTLAILSLICFLLYLAWHFWEVIGWNTDLVKSLPNRCALIDEKGIAKGDIIDLAKCTEITRNFGWMLWMLLSVTGVGFGLWLTWWGRHIQNKQWDTQHKSHLQRRDESLQERYEKATEMLGSDVELVRIGGCRSLMNLGINEESMKIACVGLLFDFMDNPYLEVDDKNKPLYKLFPADKSLRPDIQSAIDSFFTICKYYGTTGINNRLEKLPKYFWVNQKKERIVLPEANLQGINFGGANLASANLRGARLQRVNLESANLELADLRRANLSRANLQGAILKGANSREADLRVASLQKANLQGANFLVANLRTANLRGSNLQDANLSMASLLETDLQSANLQNANLRKTRLKGANLARADLRRADISAASLQEAENLTKKQILSAQWGYAKYGSRHQPQLPEALEQDEDIKKWLETPAYNRRKKLEELEE